MISETKLAKWERLANEATPETWYTDEDEPSTIMAWEGDEYSAWEVATHVETPDADFICAARTAMPELIAEVRSLQKMLHVVSDTSNKILDDNNRLEKEADWLADKVFRLSNLCADPQKKKSGDCKGECAKCWREVARKATECK